MTGEHKQNCKVMLRNCKVDAVEAGCVLCYDGVIKMKENSRMKLQDKIIVHRKANGWSQEDFADKLHVSRQAISRWENGTALPDAQNILQISKLFHITTDYLLHDEYESDSDIPAVRTAAEETEAVFLKEKRPHLVAAISFSIASVCWIIAMATSTRDVTKALFAFSFALSTFSAASQFLLYFRKR